MDEFKPNSYELHTVSGNYWEWYSEWTHSSFHLRKAAQAAAECARMTTVSFPNPQRNPIPQRHL
jgi:formylglycine-generating enzyme required for sulfatase activity